MNNSNVNPNHAPDILSCFRLTKHYQDGNRIVKVLDDIDFSVYPGDKIAILGPSGSGKSTLLHLLGALDKPSSGHVLIAGKDGQKISEKQRCQLRNRQLGFIYQFHHLLPEFTALENVAIPLLIGGESFSFANAEAKKILSEVGLEKRLQHKPAHLSGGERQRVAIARALVQKPQCILADEPTGNLDHETAMSVFERILLLNKENQTALVMVTHDEKLAAQLNQQYYLQSGKLQPLNK